MTAEHSAWDPGLESDIPPAYRRLESIYRTENVTSSIAYVDEISRQTGLSPQELVVFRPERLVLHELIVRVTADIVVLEGKDEAELGRNFRHIANTILNSHIQPQMTGITQAYDELRKIVYRRVQQELIDILFTARRPESADRGFFSFGWRGKTKKGPVRRESIQEREHRAISSFKEKGLAANDPLTHVIYKSLYRVLGLIAGTRGYLGPDQLFLTELVCNHVCNSYGSEMIGRKIAFRIEKAIEKEGYARIPNTENPILISLKGASAAGKSSLRPMLKQTMSEQGILSQGYATISPDIWRRLLLDYNALGEAYKYAGRLTSHEVIIIDRKLDHYIRHKADRHGSIPHLLVDRFRFDSFSSERISKILHSTYVQYVDTMYMYFVVTPPEATVERGWERGLHTGRYKAVEDFLDHSVEAYIGMPKILFKWLAYDRPLLRYVFLDNSVPKGTYPTTVAFGTQDELNILDCLVFINIERYQKINIRAGTPREVYPAKTILSVANNCEFLKQCIRKIPCVNFLDHAAGAAYLTAREGVFRISDARVLAKKLENPERAQVFGEIAPRLSEIMKE